MDKIETLKREIEEVLSVARKRGMEIYNYWSQVLVGGRLLIIFLNFSIGVDIKYLKTKQAKRLASEFICKWVEEYIKRFESEGYKAYSTLESEWDISPMLYLRIPKTMSEEEVIRVLSIAKKWLEDMLGDFTYNLLPKLIALDLKG